MSSLYVNESGAVISVDGGYFCVTQKNGLVRKLPKELVESITIFGNSSVTTPCIQRQMCIRDRRKLLLRQRRLLREAVVNTACQRRAPEEADLCL